MNSKPKVFFDSDVVISSLISTTGASYLLLDNKDISKNISNFSLKELNIVIDRLKIPKSKFKISARKFNIIKLDNFDKIKEKFAYYVVDKGDAHILAGAVKAKCRFLISYNLKHFKLVKIKRDFDINILTPGSLLQYLRSFDIWNTY